MQRVRVGLTGLGAVLLIVAVSAAIFETATHQPEPDAGPAAGGTVNVANLVTNATDAPTEPLAEIGLTPSAPTPAADNAAEPGRK